MQKDSKFGVYTILKKIADNPGATAKQLGGNSGVYRSLSKLANRGFIRFERVSYGTFDTFGARAHFYATDSGIEYIQNEDTK